MRIKYLICSFYAVESALNLFGYSLFFLLVYHFDIIKI